jgi:hypothetical protein
MATSSRQGPTKEACATGGLTDSVCHAAVTPVHDFMKAQVVCRNPKHPLESLRGHCSYVLLEEPRNRGELSETARVTCMMQQIAVVKTNTLCYM